MLRNRSLFVIYFVGLLNLLISLFSSVYIQSLTPNHTHFCIPRVCLFRTILSALDSALKGPSQWVASSKVTTLLSLLNSAKGRHRQKSLVGGTKESSGYLSLTTMGLCLTDERKLTTEASFPVCGYFSTVPTLTRFL